MLIGEMCLLVAAVLVMTGLVKGITARLYVNDFFASFIIFVIVLLNVRGGIRLTGSFSLYLGGVLSVLVSLYAFIRRSEKASDYALGLIGAAFSAAIAFVYTMVFTAVKNLDMRLVALILSLLSGVFCALFSKRTFASCLFTSVTGNFLGITLYQIIIQKSGEIGGDYSFSVMWMSAIFALFLQYLLAYAMRAVNSPRANTFFEAGEMKEEEEKKGNGENK